MSVHVLHCREELQHQALHLPQREMPLKTEAPPATQVKGRDTRETKRTISTSKARRLFGYTYSSTSLQAAQPSAYMQSTSKTPFFITCCLQLAWIVLRSSCVGSISPGILSVQDRSDEPRRTSAGRMERFPIFRESHRSSQDLDNNSGPLPNHPPLRMELPGWCQHRHLPLSTYAMYLFPSEL